MTLSDDKIQTMLSSSSDFDNWELKDDKIVKIFQFPSFMHSINFVNKIAVSESSSNNNYKLETVKIFFKII